MRTEVCPRLMKVLHDEWLCKRSSTRDACTRVQQARMGTAQLRTSRSSRPKRGASTLEGVVEAISDVRCESGAVGGEPKALSICRSEGTKISDILGYFS